MRTQPQEIIRQLEEDNSRLAKEQVLENNPGLIFHQALFVM